MAESPTQKAKQEGIKKYERFILDVCNIEHFSLLTKEEKDGYYGVAMLLAYQEGAKPIIKDFAYHLRVSPVLLEEAFKSLRANGIFTASYQKPVKVEGGLEIGRNALSTMWMSSKKRDLVDWCWVAGIGSGLAGLKK